MKKIRPPTKDNYLKIIYILLTVIAIESVFLIASYQRKEKVKVEVKIKSEKERPGLKEAIKPQIFQGKIAIVLDDWGYNLNNAAILEEIKEPLTLAILPRRAYSTQIALRARQLKKETILHLPMQPRQEKKVLLEPDTILINMTKFQIGEILEADIKSLPGIKGVSNHMGSRATESEALMRIIFGELKKRKLFFLDSFTGKTVGKELAASIGLPYARRYVFLDNKNDPDYIMAQIETLAKIARQEGSSIGIGHDRRKTLEVLVRLLPELEKRGFKFVYVSELVK